MTILPWSQAKKRGRLALCLALWAGAANAGAPHAGAPHAGAPHAGAQSRDEQKQLEIEWQAGDKALLEERFGAALSHFNRVLAILERPKSRAGPETLAAALHNRADALYSLENWAAALRDYSRVIELTPQNADAYAFRAVARKTQGDYDGLIEDAQKATDLDAEYAYLLDDARSTVLFRRVRLGFFGLGLLVLALGAAPMLKSLIQLLKLG